MSNELERCAAARDLAVADQVMLQEKLGDKRAVLDLAEETIELLTQERDTARVELQACKALNKSAGVTVRAQLDQIKQLTEERDRARETCDLLFCAGYDRTEEGRREPESLENLIELILEGGK